MAYAGIKIGDMYFNAIVSSTHEFSCTLAQHTMESGVTVTDHVILEPRRFSVAVDICNTTVDTRSIQAFQTIERAWRNREPFTVITHHGIYDNMVIESGSFVENDIEPGRLTGTLALQQLMFNVIKTGGNDRIDPNVLPGTRVGIAAIPQSDHGIILQDPSAIYDITAPGVLETAAEGGLDQNLNMLAVAEVPDLSSLLESSLSAAPGVTEDLRLPGSIPGSEAAAKPSKFPISYKNGNITFASPVAQDTFNRFRTYTSYGMDAAHVLLDVMDVDGNPIRSGINMVPGGDNLLKGHTDDIKINVLDITPRLPIGERIGADSVQICAGAAETVWPRIMRYD